MNPNVCSLDILAFGAVARSACAGESALRSASMTRRKARDGEKKKKISPTFSRLPLFSPNDVVMGVQM